MRRNRDNNIFRLALRSATPAAVGAGIMASVLAGCTEPTGPKTVASRDLSVKIPAIKEAAETKDKAAVRQLVTDLDSDDDAVRMYAIRGLRDITGEEFGYVYYADFERRRPAVQKWRDWLAARDGKAAAPTTAAPTTQSE